MANPEQLAKLNEGVEAWNQWKVTNQEATIDLSEADLAGKDLTGADLQGALLPHASLRGTKMRHGTLLWQADLQQSDLCEADLSGADLKGVNFAQADLFEASLREADLQSADLSSVKGGLRTEQLAGADLTGAKLPDDLKKLYDSLDNVKGISESARKIFLAVLAACLYCWLTIATTTDVNLITNRASSPLPIIQTPIPIVGFYVVAPLLVLCVYFYLHFYLQKMWEELGSLPAVFPDGRPLYTKVDPWLLNDLVRAHLPKLKADRPFLSYFQLWISVLLAWWVVPTTIFLFWGRYLRRHERVWTTFHMLLVLVSVIAATCLYQLAVATLQGGQRKPFRRSLILTSRRARTITISAVVIGLLLGWLSWETRWAPREALIPRLMTWFGYSPYAHLDGGEISQKKPGWNKTNDPDSVIGANLRGANLRYASAARAFFADADLLNADLSGAQLLGADLTRAHLDRAKLRSTNLFAAQMTAAKLNSSDLSYAGLHQSCLTGAKMSSAHLNHADLGFANLKGADMSHAVATGAYLAGANLADADLSSATLRGADLSMAELLGTQLTWAEGLDPKQLEHVRDADLAFYGPVILRQLGLPSGHDKDLSEQLHSNKHLLENLNAYRWPASDPCQTTP